MIRAAGVPDASPGLLGRGGGSTMRKSGSAGKFWADMTRLHLYQRALGETGDFIGVFGHLGALIWVAGVPDASSCPLGREGGSAMQKRGSDGKFWAAMTCF